MQEQNQQQQKMLDLNYNVGLEIIKGEILIRQEGRPTQILEQ